MLYVLKKHQNIRIRFGVLMAFGTVQAMTFPFMAIYFDRYFGEVLTGYLLVASVLASLFSGALGGFYADRIGRKKLMVLSESIFLISYGAMAFANSPWYSSPVLTFFAYLINNICFGVYAPADEAMLLDVTLPEDRQAMYTLFYWANNLTMAVGASIGAILFDADRFLLFSLMTLVLVGTLLSTIFWIQETFQPIQNDKTLKPVVIKDLLVHYLHVFKDMLFMKYFIASTLVMAVEFQMSNYIGIHLTKTIISHTVTIAPHLAFHLDGIKMLGFIQTENTVLVVILAGLAAKWVKNYSEKWVLLFGILLQTMGYSVMTFVSIPSVLFVAMFIATIGEVTGVPVRQAFLGDIAPEHSRASYLAVNGMTFSLARVLASFGVALGAIIPDWGIGIVSMLIGIIGFIFYAAMVPAVVKIRNNPTTINL